MIEHQLLYSEKGSEEKFPCSIIIGNPLIVENDVSHKNNRIGCYYCDVTISPLEDLSFIVYGANALQAINHASDIKFLLKKINTNYDFYHVDGGPVIM